MPGNSASGNRTARRGHPTPTRLPQQQRRITIRDDLALRLSTIAAPVGSITTAANDIIRMWLDAHYPEQDKKE